MEVEDSPKELGEAAVVGAILETLRDRRGALVLAGLMALSCDGEEGERSEQALIERTTELELVIQMVESGLWRRDGESEPESETGVGVGYRGP
jgi:hypothetical protein